MCRGMTRERFGIADALMDPEVTAFGDDAVGRHCVARSFVPNATPLHLTRRLRSRPLLKPPISAIPFFDSESGTAYRADDDGTNSNLRTVNEPLSTKTTDPFGSQAR